MRAFLRGLSAVTLVNVANGVLGVVIVPVAVKRLGIQGYGLYSIFSVLAGYLILVELGLGKNLVRLLGSAATEEETRRLLQLALGMYVAIAGGLIILSPILLPLVTSFMFRVPPENVITVRWITVIAITDYLLGIPSSLRWNFALSRERIGDYARFMLQSNCARYVLMLAGVIATNRVEFALAFVLVRRVIDLAVAPRLLPRLPHGAWRPRFNASEGRALLGQSSLLAMTQLLQLSTVAIGSILVNLFFGLTALGVYRSTFDVVSKVWFFSNTAQTVLYPKFVQLLRREHSRVRLLRVLAGIQAASWLVYSFLGAFGTIAASVLLRILHLSATTSPLLFSLLLAGVLWNAHAVLSSELLQADAEFGRVALAAGISFIAMTVVFVVLARVMPTEAIGWAWIPSQFIGSALVDFYAVRGLRGSIHFGSVLRQRAPGGALIIAALLWRSNANALFSAAIGLLAAALMFIHLPAVRAAILELLRGAPAKDMLA